MKKLHLDIDTLRVESFTTQVQPRGTGTVRGHFYEETNGGSCFSNLCFPTDWCDSRNCASANASCATTCTHDN
jgi:hypothetical protein